MGIMDVSDSNAIDSQKKDRWFNEGPLEPIRVETKQKNSTKAKYYYLNNNSS